jgi:hypothetical protein
MKGLDEMRRGQWVCLTVYMVPTDIRARDLRHLARKCIVLSVMEGWLWCPITLGGTLDVVIRLKGGEPCHGQLIAEPIYRIEAPYLATRWELYCIVKSAAPGNESFGRFA